MSGVRAMVYAIYQLKSVAFLASCPTCGGSGRAAGLPSLPLACENCEGTGASPA